MIASNPCPDLDDYRQLVSGQLAEVQAESLLRHLETCSACAGKIQMLPASDTLIEWIRQTKTSTPLPQEKQLNPLIQHLIQLGKSTGRLIFSCAGCGKPLRAKEEAAGKKVKCPHCGQVMAAPKVGGTGETPVGSQTSASANMETVSLPTPSSGAPKAGTSSGTPTAATRGLSRKERELCSFLAPLQAPDELGRLGLYRVLKVLGAGGMGVVFRAEDPQLQRIVALKAMLPGLAENEGLRQRFLREARLAASLKHDHVVTIHQVGEDRGAPFLAMEFLEGESLEDHLKREGKLSLAEVLRIGSEIADGLQAAHERGLIHRDIKPGNIWLEKFRGERGASTPPYRVKILDFGLARSSSDDIHLTQSGAIVGTPAYMSPEQARGEKVDFRCDLYSLGCVLYRLCTGELPFKGDSAMSLLLALAIDQPKSPREVNPDVPPPLADLILRLLAKDPAQRPATGAIVAENLQALERGLLREQEFHEQKTVPSSPPQVETSPNKRRLVVAIAAGLLGIAVVLAGIVIIIRNRKGEETARIHVSDGGRIEIVDEGAKAALLPKKQSEWVQLFNGKDLTGWKTHPQGPGDWRVEDGVLVGRGPEKSCLFSERGDYEDFHFRIEAAINEGGNSGQEFRKSFSPTVSFTGYEAQIDSSKHGAKTGSLFAGKGNPAVSIAEALVPVDTWFTQEVIARGNHIVVLVNGKKVVDYIDQNNTFRRGHLALQVWEPETVIRFRKIEVKELPPHAGAGMEVLPSDAFFNGKDLTGWEGLKEYWSVKDGVIVGALPPEKLPFFNTFLCSKKKYRDFELSFQVRLKDGKGNSGVQIRSWISAPQTFGVRGPQCEIGDVVWPWGSLVTEPNGNPGIRADKDAVARVLRENDFNDYSIKCVDKHVTIKLNGITTVDADFPTLPDEGIIAWQLHTWHPGMEVAFKNIAFKELPPRRAAITPPVQIPEPPPLAEWLKGRRVLTVAQDGSGQFKTIQAALNALEPHQVVKVLDRGPYRESFRLESPPDDVGLVSETDTVVEITDWEMDAPGSHQEVGLRGAL